MTSSATAASATSGARRPRRTIAEATATASNGARKMRCLDSGAAEPPSRASTKAAAVTPTEQRTKARARRRMHDDADDRSREDCERDGPPAGRRVTERAPQVTRNRAGPAELLAAAADADVEAFDEHEIGEPEREAEDEHRERLRRPPP